MSGLPGPWPSPTECLGVTALKPGQGGLVEALRLPGGLPKKDREETLGLLEEGGSPPWAKETPGAFEGWGEGRCCAGEGGSLLWSCSAPPSPAGSGVLFSQLLLLPSDPNTLRAPRLAPLLRPVTSNPGSFDKHGCLRSTRYSQDLCQGPPDCRPHGLFSPGAPGRLLTDSVSKGPGEAPHLATWCPHRWAQQGARAKAWSSGHTWREGVLGLCPPDSPTALLNGAGRGRQPHFVTLWSLSRLSLGGEGAVDSAFLRLLGCSFSSPTPNVRSPIAIFGPVPAPHPPSSGVIKPQSYSLSEP